MIDPFLILTPILILAILALVRFVGCNAVFGLQETTQAPNTPVLVTLKPPFVTQGDPNFSTLTVIGAEFVTPSTVQWNGNDLPTAFFSSKELAATITPDLIAAPGQAQITVYTSGASDPTSNALTFNIDSNDIIVTFDADVLGPAPPGVPGDTIDAPYKHINFGVGQWIWQGPIGAATGNSINLNFGGAGDVLRSFSFANGARKLRRIRVFVEIDPDMTQMPDVTITDDNSPAQTKSQNIMQADGLAYVDVNTEWPKPSGTVTVESTLGQYFHIDRIVYEGPA